MEYDLIIVGGGMVGATLALALQNTALRIALVDKASLTHNEDPRLIALNYSSFCLFNNLKIGSALLPFAAPIQQVHVSQQGHLGITRITAEEIQLAALGYVVPAKEINGVLYTALTAAKNIKLMHSASVTALTQNEKGVSLTVACAGTSYTLLAKGVIGADGSYSTIRELLSLPTEILDYHQSALVTITELHRPHKNIAYERFQRQGAIAMLPLIGQRVATIWTDKTEAISHLLQLSDEEFLTTLQKQFGYRLGRLMHIGKRAVFPLKMICAQQRLKNNVLLVGNAAHTLHPIAAQGLNLALFEVAQLAEFFHASVSGTIALNHLPDYHRQHHFSKLLSHQLARVFSSDFFMVTIARSMGMIGLDIFSPAKRHFALQAIGRTGQIPHLLLE